MRNIIVIPNGHGHMTTDTLISVYIALLIVPIFIFLIRAVLWFFKKKKSFYNYTIWCDNDDTMPNVITTLFVIINIMAGFVALVGLIIHLRND
jgi:hypothetical protein